MKINYNIFKRKVAPFILSFGLLTSFTGCSIETSNNSNSITITNSSDEKLLKPLLKAGFNIIEIPVQENFPIYKLENNIPEYFTKIEPSNDGSNIYNIYETFSYDKRCTVKEFKKYINYGTITWNDIKDSLKNNTNIDNNIKNIILGGINNLEKNKFNIDLSVLNYNLNNLNVIFSTKDEYLPVEVMAKFEAFNHTLYINPSTLNDPSFNDIVIHEILGHGSNIAYLDNEKIYCSTTFSSAIIEDQGVLLGNVVLGKSFEEGLAEYIRCIATNKIIDANETVYSVPLYFLLLMCNSTNTKIDEYANSGVEYLIKNMEKNKLGSVAHFIELLDIKFHYISLSDIDVNWDYNDILYQYLVIYSSKLYNEGKSIDSITNNINDICNIYKRYIKSIDVDNSDMLYTPKPNGELSFLACDYVKEQVIEYVKGNNKQY